MIKAIYRNHWRCLPIVALIFLAFNVFAQSPIPEKNYVFNLTGSMRGFGDITGPLFTIVAFKKQRSDANFVVVIDRRAEKIIEELYSLSLDEVGRELGLQFYLITDAKRIPKSDISFELFFGGRFIHDFTRVVFNTEETAVVISDTMHGTTLDEVRGPDFHFYFKPPGIGSARSGIIKNPEIDKFLKSASLPMTAAHFFDDQALKNLLLKIGWRSKILLGFVYGVHNEIFKEELIGQTRLFAQQLERAHPSRPIVLFTPNSEDELLAARIKKQQILRLSDLGRLTGLENGVHFLPLTGLNNSQFISLMAASDLPVLVEGNSSLSAAIGLGKEFLLMRSAWNGPQIKDLLDVDAAAKTYLYSDVYPPNGLPLFSHYFSKPASGRMFGKFFLEARLGEFSRKLVFISTLIDELRKGAKADYRKILADVEKYGQDEYLEYSLVLDLFKRKKISPAVLYKVRKKFKAQGHKRQTIEARLQPNQPNFSKKIEELEAQGFLFEDIRDDTAMLNQKPVQIPIPQPVCLGPQTGIELEEFSCATNLDKLKERGDFSKVVWTFWDKGASALPAFNRYNVQQWRRILGDSWAVVVVSSDRNDPCYFKNAHFSVDDADLPANFDRLNESISGFDRTSVGVVQSDIVRLALLKKYGGVWMDSSIVLLNHLDALPWTYILLDSGKDIAGYINEGQSSNKFKKIDGFENWFIAAKRGSTVVSDWLKAFNSYWETKQKDQDITEHPMYRGKVNLDHISPYYRNYLSQHAAMSYVLTKNPRLIERFVVNPAEGAYRYADIAGWDPNDIYDMFVTSGNFEAYREILIDEENVDILKFPSANLKVVQKNLDNIGMYYSCDNLISYLYSGVGNARR